MNKGIKIFLGIIISLGILSAIFLIFSKGDSQVPAQTANTQKTVPAPKNSTVAPGANNIASNNNNINNSNDVTPQAPSPQAKPNASVQDRKALVRSQWSQCKSKTLPADTELFWSVKISEGIPDGGTYAKGDLDSDNAFPVRVIIKSDSKLAEKIKSMLVVGKVAFLRGTCTEVAPDGSVVLQAF